MSGYIGTIIIAGLKALFGDRLKKAGVDDALIEKIVDKAIQKALPTAIAEADEAIRRELDALQMQVAFDHLDELLRDTDDWFKPKGEIPNLGLPFDTSDASGSPSE